MIRTARIFAPKRRTLRPRRLSLSQLVALLAVPAVLLILAVLYVIVVAIQGRPFLYVSERMRSTDESFRLFKIRTMRPVEGDADQSVLCGFQSRRVTRIGGVLRRTRLDELPQIFNVLKGDIRFIGPRPPLRRYVKAYPELYGQILGDMPPGITGLATVIVHRREERLLAACKDPVEADRVYRERCIPLKARLDLIYHRNRGPRLDALILLRTFTRLAARKTRRGISPVSGTRPPRPIVAGLPAVLPRPAREAA